MVELIPRKVLFGNPERVSPELSPDGTRLAWIAPSGGVLNVWLAPVSPADGGSVGAETARLVRIDLAGGAEEVLAADDEADVSGVRIDPDTREPQVAVLLKERSEYLVLDQSVAADVAAIRALHRGDPNFVSADDADSTWLI